MPLQQLVEYFNDRFGQEHHSSFRPILLEDGLVSGLFGSIRIKSNFLALRHTLKPEVISGYGAQISVSTYDPLLLHAQQLDSLFHDADAYNGNFESIVNFDRLARTVHMLNYLPISHLEQTLFLDVDPRHILGIQKDHGAYFEDVLTRCGLQTSNVAIVTGVNKNYAKYYEQLITGLDNYRSRGYRIALRLNDIVKEHYTLDFIEKVAPNYVSISTRSLEDYAHGDLLDQTLAELRTRVSTIEGQIILQQIYEKRFDQLARQHGIDFVEGAYYRVRDVIASKAQGPGKKVSYA